MEKIRDIFYLLQQIEEQDEVAVKELKRELIKCIEERNFTEETKSKKNNNKLRNNMSIEEAYELTKGTLEYPEVKAIVEEIFYLVKGQAYARELAGIIREITKENLKYEKVIEYIENNAFVVKPVRHTKQMSKIRIPNKMISLKDNEMGLLEQVKHLTDEQQAEILESGGTSNLIEKIIGNVVSNTNHIQKKEDYYINAIIDSYNWKKSGINKLWKMHRRDLVRKLKEIDGISISKKLAGEGITERNMLIAIMNKVLTKKTSKEFNQIPTIEQIEEFLGYQEMVSNMELRDHQKIASNQINKIWKNKKFATVILPTGAGKSFIAIEKILEGRNEPMLCLAPNKEILEQMKEDIVQYVHGKKGTVGRTREEIIAKIFPNIKFETYQSLLTKKGEDTINKQYARIVLDELHRTGANEWEKKLEKLLENQKDCKILGMTATPIRDVDNRNMADTLALKLGYTKEEVKKQKHIAIKMNLIEAIKLGMVVNPRVVGCEYIVNNNRNMENLLKLIKEIPDEKEKKEKLERYRKLRRDLQNAKGLPEIIRTNVKQNGKYIVFIPIKEQEEIVKDKNGNAVGKNRDGKDKIKTYEEYLKECFKDFDEMPKFYSMLGAFGNKRNQEQLGEFENDDSEGIKFMIVMNKANEGIHIGGLNGMIWLRTLDENSIILYLQQLGRILYSEDPNNPTKDEDRPIVIDPHNNVTWMSGAIDKERKHNHRKEDIELLTIVVDWINFYGRIPNIESENKQEKRYTATLYRILNKYKKYVEGFENAPNLSKEEIEEIKGIIEKGNEVDLWNLELPPKTPKTIDKILEGEIFELDSITKDFYQLKDEVDTIIKEKGVVRDFIEIVKKLQLIGVDISKLTNADTIETLAKKSGIGEEEIRKIGLDPMKGIGRRKANIALAYRGYEGYTPPTIQEFQELKKLGITLEKRDTTSQELIKIVKKLKSIGVDVSKMRQLDTIQTLAERSGIGEEEVRRIGLDPTRKIGNKKDSIAGIYRGIIKSKTLTNQEVEELRGFGIELEKKDTVSQELIKMAKKLKSIGVDVSKIQSEDTIQTLAKKSGISEETVRETGLDPTVRIGGKKESVARIYRGVKDYNTLTNQEVKELKELGINLERKLKLAKRGTSAQETIEKFKKLKAIGVDVSKVRQMDTIEALAKKSGISKEAVIKMGLDPTDKIGSKKETLAAIYRGTKNQATLTEKQIQEVKELGLNLERKRRRGVKEIAKAAISLDNIEMVDQEEVALKCLLERSEEGEIRNE